MPRKFSFVIVAALGAITLLGSTGCEVACGPNLGLLGYPIPVSTYYQDKLEDKFWEKEHYKKVPILGPLTAGGPVQALDPPSDDEIMRALERAHPIEGGLPLLHEQHRNNVRIVKELIADYIDPPRVIPLAGPVQQHHAHYKCTIFYTAVKHVGWPIPHTLTDEDSQEVIYIDHNHFHVVGNTETGISGNY